jgi:hypothetical protein
LDLCKDLYIHFKLNYLKDHEFLFDNNELMNYFGRNFIPGFKI